MGESGGLVMFVTADDEDTARTVFRRAKNYRKCEGGKKENKEDKKFSDNRIYIYIYIYKR